MQSYNTKKKIKNYLEFLEKQPKGVLYSEKKIDTFKSQQKNNKTRVGEKADVKKEKLEHLKSKYKDCNACPLANQGRSQIVLGHGNFNAKLMFIGEGPGKDEDIQGIPFVGRAGQLLTKIIEASGIKRGDVYISNIVKCRPPNNRTPLPNESKICKNNILYKEIEIIKPKIICTLGSVATQEILNKPISITKVRGKFFKFNGIFILPTFHPAYILRNPTRKKDSWEDVKKLAEKLKQS